MKIICSLITVNEINRSREFYERILDQKVKVDYGENSTYRGDFAIHLKSHFQGLIDNVDIRTRSNNFELYFEHDDIEQLVDRLNSYGVIYVHELREQPCRQMVVRFYDPDENIIEVGESLEYLAYRLKNEGLSIEQISKTTNMPIAFVNESIEKYNK